MLPCCARSGNLTRLMSSPVGAEMTSGLFMEIGDWGYVTVVVQHPYEGSWSSSLPDFASTGRAAAVGTLGPFHKSWYKSQDMKFEGIPYSVGSARHQVQTTGTVHVNTKYKGNKGK